jgi:uncharacterized protein YlxP (DUF503 family)
MFVLALSVELHLPECRSLKAKRSVLKPVTEGARRRYNVAVAETDHQNTWQRAAIGVAAVSATAHHAEEVVDEVERFIWSFPNLQVLSAARSWMEID